jgi:hypothetical protein
LTGGELTSAGATVPGELAVAGRISDDVAAADAGALTTMRWPQALHLIL